MNTAPNFKFPLGAEVKDKVTGYQGIITGRTEWLFGCLRYTVQSQEKHDGVAVKPECFDEGALKPISDGLSADAVQTRSVTPPGGPGEVPARRADATR